MAIKKVYYNGNSKIIQALCTAVDDLIDGGGGGGSTVTITPALSSGTKVADYSIDGVSDALYAPTQPTKTSDLTNDSNYVSDASYVHTDNNYTTAEQTKLADIESGAQANVQSNWNESDSSADDYIKNKPAIYNAVDLIVGDTNKLTKIYNGLDSSGGQGAAAVITFQTTSGTVAFLTDLPAKLSDLVDDVVSGNYLPLSGGIMNGQIKIHGASVPSVSSATYMLTLDDGVADDKPISEIPLSSVTVGNASKLGNASADVNATGSTIVKRNVSGYIYGVYFNQSSADESGTFASNAYYMLWLNAADGRFFRKVTINALYDLFHRAYWNNGSGSYNFGYTTGNVGSLGGQLISYNSNASGYTRMYASAFNSPSCKFLKENVRDITIEDARKVFDLRPVFFDYKEPYGEKGQQGLIAEEAYKVLPSIVDKGEDWDISEDADEYNQEQIEEHFMDVSGDIPSIEYSKIVPYLIKIVQDQEQRICDLENRIADLEGMKVSVWKEQ